MSDIIMECPNCKALVDASHSLKDGDRVICGKCGHDIGDYTEIKAKFELLIRGNAPPSPKSTKH